MIRRSALVVVFASLVLSAEEAIGATQSDPIRGHVAMVLGDSEGDDQYLFGHVSQIQVAEGRLFVLDALLGRIQVYSTSGEYLETYGRKGSGPGEFQDSWTFGVTSDGVIAVRDVGKKLYLVGTLNDGFSRSIPVPSLFSLREPIRTDTNGRFFDSFRVFADSTTPHELHGYDPDSVTPVQTFQLPMMHEEFVDVPTSAGPGRYVRVPFSPVLAWDVLPSGEVVFATGTDDKVHILGATGVVRSFEAGLPGLAVPRSIRADSIRAALELLRDPLSGAAARPDRKARRRLEAFPTYPPVMDLYIDSEGRVVVRHPTTDGSLLLSLHSASGDPLHRLEFSDTEGFTWLWKTGVFDGDRLFVVRRDQNGVHQVVSVTWRVAPRG